MTGIPHLLTLTQFAERHPAWTVPSLRWLVFRASENGFENAFVRVGRRVLIDEAKFFAAIKRQNQGAA